MKVIKEQIHKQKKVGKSTRPRGFHRGSCPAESRDRANAGESSQSAENRREAPLFVKASVILAGA